jgi:hypothetical protein
LESSENTHESHFQVTEVNDKPMFSVRQPRLSFATTCLSYSPEQESLDCPDSPADCLERIDLKLRNQGLRFLDMTSESNFQQLRGLVSNEYDLFEFYLTLN